MKHRPKFIYGLTGSETTLELTLSQGLWTPADMTIGGSRTSAAGVPCAYIVRRDALLDVTLRFWEAEWPDLYNLIQWGQSSESFLFYPDQDEGTAWQVYLEAPLAGVRFAPTRDQFSRVHLITLTLRGAGITVPWQPYFAS